MSEAKQRAIQEAWILEQLHASSEGVPNYNSDGWAKYGSKQNSSYFNQLEEKQWLGYFFYRPKSLEGIENNNGWIEYKENGIGYLDIVYTDAGNIYPYAVYVAYSSINEIQEVTHYQPIQKPNKPIY